MLDVKNEQSSTDSPGAAIEKAMTSGNFATAKQAMLRAYNVDLANVNKALGRDQDGPGQRAGRVQGPALVRDDFPQ